MRFLFGALLALVAPAFAAAPPKPQPTPQTVVTQQGTSARSISSRPANLTIVESIDGSVTVNGTRFPNHNTLTVQFVGNLPKCPAKPPVASRDIQCPSGTSGHWTQTQDWASQPYPMCWAALPWAPTQPPDGVCVPEATGFVPAVNVSADPLAPKPALGTIVQTAHYGTTYSRVTDHVADGFNMARNDYSRRQPVNLDGTKLLVANSDENWYAYDISDPVHARFVEKLNGPQGDAESQWSATDPDVVLFLDRNGGTQLKQVKVSTNANSVVWDFGPIVRGYWPSSAHCWTKSEGSPSADGSRWGLMCEDGSFNPLGFVVLDINARTAVWHQNNSNRPDHVSIDPTGRYFVAGWNGSPGVIAYDTTGAQPQKTLNGYAEHSDLGVCNGRGFYASIDYSTNQGDIFYSYLDDGVRHVVGYIYGHPNPWFQTNYAIHVSAKAFGKCGFLSSNYGVPPANIVWWDFAAPPNTPYGVGINYSKDRDYWEEVQAAISRDGNSFFYNDTFNGAQDDVDVYRGTMPQ